MADTPLPVYAGRDELIWNVYLFPNDAVIVLDLYGNQMEQYQDPAARDALKAAYPERLWHSWDAPGRCRCGRTIGEHAREHPHYERPPLSKEEEHTA